MEEKTTTGATVKKKNNIPPANDLMPVSEYASTYISRRGFPVTVQYIYNLITANKMTGKILPFKYVEIGKQIWVRKERSSSKY